MSAYVSRWLTEAIVTDWDGYKLAADAFRKVIQACVDEEVVLLRLILRRQQGG